MKKIKLLVIFALFFLSVSAALINSKESTSKFTAQEISRMSAKQYGELRGKKLNFKERVVFKSLKKEMVQQTKIGNGNKDMKAFMETAMAEGERAFNFGGFFVGFALGIIGVALAHIFSKDKDFRRSSWQGLGAWVILILILALI